MGVEVGDWVSFMRNDEIVIGEVRYIRLDVISRSGYTTAGMVDEKSILEKRVHDGPDTDG